MNGTFELVLTALVCWFLAGLTAAMWAVDEAGDRDTEQWIRGLPCWRRALLMVLVVPVVLACIICEEGYKFFTKGR